MNNEIYQETKAIEQQQIVFCSGFGKYYSTKNGRYEYYCGITPAQIIERLNHPQDIDKLKAQWVIFSDYMSRSAKLQRQNGRFYALWFDIDDGNVSLEIIQSFLAKLCVRGFAYSTKSSRPDRQKWRGIIPLAEPVNGSDFEIYQEILNDRLEAFGIEPDRKIELANQICFLPNRGDYYQTIINDSTEYLNAARDFCSEFAVKVTEKTAHEALIIERKALALERAIELSVSGLSPINAFNQSYDVENMMLSYGYKFKSGKFVSPNSLSGVAQCQLVDNGRKWLSHHGSDVEAGIGRVSYNGKCCSGDAFDLFRFYECNNDFRAAVTKAGEMFRTADGKTITQANRERHTQSLANNTADITPFLASIVGGL